MNLSIFSACTRPLPWRRVNYFRIKKILKNKAWFFQKCYQFPVGPGEVLRAPKELEKVKIKHDDMLYDDVPIEGFIFLKILPPKNLIPFLLHRQDGKALAACCRTCASSYNEKECHHDEQERALVGVYCINEIVYAVQHCDYVLLEIYEIYAFKERAQIFKNFMTFLGSKKIRHSKLPSRLKTRQEKQEYCNKINTKMGFDKSIEITPENIDPNDYQKAATKSGLNSVLGRSKIRIVILLFLFAYPSFPKTGKLSQSANMPQAIVVNNQLDLDLLLNDATKEVTEILPMGEDLIQTRVKTKERYHRIAQKSSILLGSYVTR